AGCTPDVLTQRCQFLLSQGLAPSTRRVYLSAQRRYIDFCRRDGRLNSDGSFAPADEETLTRFASLLADSLTHASIKVYLSAVHSLHIDHGLSDPFGPLFTFSDGRPLTRKQLSSTVQSILHSAGYTGSYSGHSFCIGAATTAAARGVPDHLIKTLGRWSSDAYQIYIRTPVSSIVHQVSLLPLGLPWGWVPQGWALGAWGSAAPSPLAPGFLPGGPFGLARGGSWLGCGLVGLWVFFCLGVYCGCSPLAHGHPTSTCDAGVKYY
ncbi:unnamed protein product, partial [Porites evermanni]